MRSAETPLPRPEDSKDRIHRSVRVFAVAAIPSEILCGALDNGTPIDQIPLIEVVLAQKADTRQVTGIGGEILQDEDLLTAAQRKVFEKTLLTRESRNNLERIVGHEEAIPYTVHNWQDAYKTFVGWLMGKKYFREASLTVMPVRSRNISLHQPREEDDGRSVYKVKRLVNITPREFAILLKEGAVTSATGDSFQVFGHLTRALSREVSMTAEARQIQKKEIDRVIAEVRSYEDHIREQMKTQINHVRIWQGKESVSNLSECDRRELERGFLAAQWVMGMHDEQLRDEKLSDWERRKAAGGGEFREKRPKEKPTRSADLFTSALYLWEFSPEDLPEGLFSSPTREVLHTANVVKHSLRAAVIELYTRMGADITAFSSHNSVEPCTIDAVAALKSIWPDVLGLRPEKHMELLQRMDERFIQELVTRMHKPYSIVKSAMEMPDRLPRYLADEMQKTKDTFQEYHPSNDAASAIERPFVQMLHILGLHPYREITDTADEAVKHTRGEILMQEAEVFASIPIMERHVQASNVAFEKGIVSFFEAPKRELLFLNGIPHRIYSRRTIAGIGGRFLDLWHDKRPIKSEEREFMKSLIEPEMHDDFSHNFVIPDSNFTKEELVDISVRLDLVGELREALISHYRKVYSESDGWQVTVVPGTHKRHTIDAVRALIAANSKEERAAIINSMNSGKRPGSMGDSIIREKFVLSIIGHGITSETEICLYPFESAEIDGTVLKGSGLFGAKEKWENDAEKTYAGDRLIKVDPKDPTAPSNLELLQPAAMYPNLFNTIKLLQHAPKKKNGK